MRYGMWRGTEEWGAARRHRDARWTYRDPVLRWLTVGILGLAYLGNRNPGPATRRKGGTAPLPHGHGVGPCRRDAVTRWRGTATRRHTHRHHSCRWVRVAGVRDHASRRHVIHAPLDAVQLRPGRTYAQMNAIVQTIRHHATDPTLAPTKG